MKFIICVVILALAVSSQAGIAPAVIDVSHTAWGPAAWGAPALGASHWGAPAWSSAAAWGVPAWGASHWGSPAWGVPAWGSAVVGGPHGPSLSTTLGVHGPVVASHSLGLGLGHGHDGNYVAANRGSVHVAPLVGHIQSVSSSNLQPAPGTTL